MQRCGNIIRRTYNLGKQTDAVRVVLDVPRTNFEDRWTTDQQDGTGFSVWQASKVLGDYIVDNKASLPVEAGTVVELGTGLGVVGLALAKVGCEKVICTDQNEKLLELLDMNAQRNGVEDAVLCKILSWGDKSAIDDLKSFISRKGSGSSPVLIVVCSWVT